MRTQLQVTGWLGRGRASSVYKVEASGALLGTFALKWLREDDLDRARRAEDEAWLLHHLVHPAFPRCHALSVYRGRPAMLLDRVDGADLGEVLNRFGPAGEPAARAVVRRVAEALAHAEESPGPGGPLGFVHRALVPENVMATPRGDVALVDLGEAWARFPARQALSAGIPRGPEALWIAPPAATGRPGDVHLDSYGLGELLFSLLTAQRLPARFSIHPGWSRELERQLLPVASRETTEWARALLDPTPQRRPTPAELARAIRACFGMDEEGLEAWCAAAVRPATGMRRARLQSRGGLVGRTLVLDEDGGLHDAKERASLAPALRSQNGPGPAGSSRTWFIQTAGPPRPPSRSAVDGPSAPAPVPLGRRAGLALGCSLGALAGLLLVAVVFAYLSP